MDFYIQKIPPTHYVPKISNALEPPLPIPTHPPNGYIFQPGATVVRHSLAPLSSARMAQFGRAVRCISSRLCAVKASVKASEKNGFCLTSILCV